MDAAFQDTRTAWEKFQQKLNESRIFMLSLMLHIALVFLAGGIYLFHVATENADFIADGGDGLLAPTDNLPPAPEQPQETVPTESFESAAPDVNTPTIDVISTTAQTNTFKVNTANVKVTLQNADPLAKTAGNIAKGVPGGTGGLPGAMGGRTGSGRGKAAAKFNMKPKSELAIMRGLEWLRLNQSGDGSWGEKNKGAMTGLALLCFLGHGETNTSQQYGVTVSKAVQWILDEGTKFQGNLNMEGSITQTGSYEHGICTYALGEYYTMTKDERVIELFKLAIKKITEGQGPGGGWMYSFDKSANDLSVSGWQIQALKAAHLSQLNLPGVDASLDKAMEYIDRVKGPKGGYGYRGPEDRYSLSGVGVLCRLFWKGDRADVSKGMDFILDETEKHKKPIEYKGDNADLYAWYYHTQAALMYGGAAWQKWNRWFQDEICDSQNPDGSWPAPGGKMHGPANEESMTGKVYRTTFCILMLEVYYRYMPSHVQL